MPSGDAPTLKIRLLGPLSIERQGQAQTIPASRKTRAILGYLVLSPRPVSRQRLCDLFFDAPDDPRASLRWSLTKLRPLVDEPDRPRLIAERDTLVFDAAGADVDALRILAAPFEGAVDAELARLLLEPSAPVLEDAELPDRTDFAAWLNATREDLRFAQIRGVRALLKQAQEPDRALPLYRRWLTLDPLDETANRDLIGALAQLGRTEEAQMTLAAAERAFARAGLKASPSMRAALSPSKSQPIATPTPSPAPERAASATTLLDLLPGVAIVPFHNYSPNDVSPMLAEGFLESTIHILTRFRSFRVSAMGDVLKFGEQMPDPASLARATGAEYVVGGSILVRDGRVKVRYRVVEAKTANLLSNGDFDADFADPTCLLEDVPSLLAVHVSHQLQELARVRAASVPKLERTAADHFFCGVNAALQLPQPHLDEALNCFNEAVALKPDFPRALGYAALLSAFTGKSKQEPHRSEALARAHAAIAMGNDDATALAVGALAVTYIARGADAATALRAVDLAVRLNPLARVVWNSSAWVRTYCGEYEAPMAHWAKADACNPLEMWMDAVDCGRALCCWFAGRYEDAARFAASGLERAPSNAAGLSVLLACAVAAEDKPAIATSAARLRAHHPDAHANPPIAELPFRDADKHAELIAAVRAGLI
jgi:DNA-binding SARP family transcriptional activator